MAALGGRGPARGGGGVSCLARCRRASSAWPDLVGSRGCGRCLARVRSGWQTLLDLLCPLTWESHLALLGAKGGRGFLCGSPAKGWGGEEYPAAEVDEPSLLLLQALLFRGCLA